MVRDRSGIDKNTPSVTVDTTDNQLPEPYTQNLDLTTDTTSRSIEHP